MSEENEERAPCPACGETGCVYRASMLATCQRCAGRGSIPLADAVEEALIRGERSSLVDDLAKRVTAQICKELDRAFFYGTTDSEKLEGLLTNVAQPRGSNRRGDGRK